MISMFSTQMRYPFSIEINIYIYNLSKFIYPYSFIRIYTYPFIHVHFFISFCTIELLFTTSTRFIFTSLRLRATRFSSFLLSLSHHAENNIQYKNRLKKHKQQMKLITLIKIISKASSRFMIYLVLSGLLLIELLV